MGNFVDTVEDRIQNVILTTIDEIIAPKIEWAFRSINASSGRDVTSFMTSSEPRKKAGITDFFENVSERDNSLHILNTNDDTRKKFPDKVSELSVPDTHFDWKPHTHHTATKNKIARMETLDELRVLCSLCWHWNPEQYFNAALKTFKIEVCWRSRFSMFFRLFAYMH